jgi:hypothetical protein
MVENKAATAVLVVVFELESFLLGIRLGLRLFPKNLITVTRSL